MSITTPDTTPAEALRALLAHHISDPDTSWSVGTFGAIAEFHRDPDEPATVTVEADRVLAVTERGAVSLAVVPGLRAFAYETPGGHGGRWNHAVALCLPSDLVHGRRRRSVTELGPDAVAIRPHERDAILFDVGLGCPQVDVCVRSASPDVLQIFRAGTGRSILEPGNAIMADMPRLSPHRVFTTSFARVEVYQPVPPPDGTTPPGPHTHVLPALIRETRTHAATVPIPDGWVPCATLYPKHPSHDDDGHARAFDLDAHAAFQSLLRQYGDEAMWALKCAVFEALDRGEEAPMQPAALSRHGRATVRVALRQWAMTHAANASLHRWAEVFDRAADEVEAA